MSPDPLSEDVLESALRADEPAVDPVARRTAVAAGLDAFDAATESAQGISRLRRLMVSKLTWRVAAMQAVLNRFFPATPGGGLIPRAAAALSIVGVAVLLTLNSDLRPGEPSERMSSPLAIGPPLIVRPESTQRMEPAAGREAVTRAQPGELRNAEPEQDMLAESAAGDALYDSDESESLATYQSPPPTAALAAKSSIAGRRLAQGRMLSAPAEPRARSGIAPSADYALAPEVGYVGKDEFRDFDDSGVRLVSESPVSTFSIDVDTAAYAFVRRQLNAGELPAKDAVRVEELVNYFDYAYRAPSVSEDDRRDGSFRGVPFATTVNLLPSPWNPNNEILHIGIQGYELDQQTRPGANLVFLVDVSGSMQSDDKLPLLKNAFKLLLDSLQENDSVAMVTYAGRERIVLEPTRVGKRGKILAALDNLAAAGSTAGAAGIRSAYALAERQFDPQRVNRVLLATDGDFNVGITDHQQLQDFIERKRDSGIYLSVLGFGQGNYHDNLMQVLAQNGNGVAAYIDTLNEARKVLAEESASTLFPIAKDVKIQVEFNPAAVREYRLIGYETRALAREDFNNDKVDAGEIGAGHRVTAIYEITRNDAAGGLVDGLRYESAAVTRTASDEIGFLRLRYKHPDDTESKLIERPVTIDDRVDAKGQPLRHQEASFAAAVAAFGQLLRGGRYTGEFSYDDVIDLARSNRGADEFGYRGEFVNLARLAKSASALGER